MRSKRLLFLAAFTAVLLTAQAFAQFSSSLQGNVLDNKGAAIAKATVTLLNIDNGVTQERAADDSGSYRFVSMAPGHYEISASAPGFSPAKVGFTLQTEENREVSITLSVGQVVSTVSVTEQAPLLDTSDSRNQLTIDAESIQSFPLAARNATSRPLPQPISAVRPERK